MAYDYSEFETLASDLIAEYGRALTMLKSGTTPNSVGEPWKGVSNRFSAATAGTEIAVTGVVLEYNERDFTDEVKRGDKYVLVAAKGIADISLYDGLNDGGSVWRIVSSNILKPGGTSLLYALQVRQ